MFFDIFIIFADDLHQGRANRFLVDGSDKNETKRTDNGTVRTEGRGGHFVGGRTLLCTYPHRCISGRSVGGRQDDGNSIHLLFQR